MNTFLDKLQKERASYEEALDAICTRAADDDDRTSFTESEEKNITELRSKMDALDTRIADLSEIELRNAKAADLAAKVDETAGKERSTSRVHVTRDEPIYREDRQRETSFFRDLSVYGRDADATNRLNMLRASSTTTFGGPTGGFVPPEFLLNKWAEYAKGGRPTANLIPNMGAPTTESMKIPKMTAGLTVAVQSSENSSLGSSDVTESDVQADTVTLGGYTDVSLQTLTLGSLPDNFIFRTLAQDYALKLETMVLGSSTANNLGLTTVTSSTAVTYTDASPTVGELYAQIGYARSQIHTLRYADAEVIIMDPVMANWIQSSRDTAGRPLTTPVNPQNAIASFANPGAAEGIRFELMGLPVCVSATVPLFTEATPSKRQIIVARISDSLLWESTPAFETFTDVGSATATVRFRLVSFVAQTHARQPKSIAIVAGTGTAITSSNFA